MGTVQSKFNSGYILHHRPLFSSFFKKGIKPIKHLFNHQNSLNSSEFIEQKHLNSEELDTQSCSSPNDEKPNHFQSNMNVSNKQYPNCCVGVVTCFLEGEQRVGTGFLIDGNKVLTCAQNIYSHQKIQIGKNISFILSFKSFEGKNIYHAKELHISQEFKENNSRKESIDELLLHNFAVIQLDSPNLQQDFGSIGFNITDKKIQNANHIIIGYDKSQHCIMTIKAEQLSHEQGLLNYDSQSFVGMNGSPIFDTSDGEFNVVGIHVSCRSKDGGLQNRGLKFSQKMLDQINHWCTQQLEEIDLRDKNIGKEGLKYLSKHKWKKIVSINLSQNHIESNWTKYFKKGHWDDLINFDLGGNMIGKNGAEALFQSNMPNIMTLNLWGNGICKEGAYYLTMAKWENLTNLNLYNNHICDEGVEYLSHANWKNLNNLNLGKNQITNEGVYHLSHGSWPQLTNLNLWGNNLSCQQSLIKQHLLNHFRKLQFLYF